MSGQSGPARLSLRAPPHLPFIQGYPGIPGGKDRKVAAVCGTVEVRVGAQPIKAKWVRVEIRRHESLPPGFPSQGDSWVLVGEIVTLWQSVGKEFDNLQTADFKFFLPLPETLPPTVELAKRTGVWYELVAALSYRKKGGIFKSDSANIMKISEPIQVVKHDLHAAWPVYNHSDQKSVAGQDLTMTIQRPGVAFGPGDRILLTASLRSDRGIPFKLKGFECTLLEVVSSIPDSTPLTKEAKRQSKIPAKPVVKSRPIAQARCAVDETMGRGGEKTARIDMAVPQDVLVTVRHAKTLEVGYEMQVKAVCEGFEGPLVPGIKYVVGQYTRALANQAMTDIGHVDALCGGPRMSRQFTPVGTPPIGSNPNRLSMQPDPRRMSTSTITTTTTTTDQYPEFSPTPNNRPYSTVPNRQSLQFPQPQPTSFIGHNSPQTSISEFSQHQNDDQHNNRYSSATAGTFGNWNTALLTNPNAQTPDLTINRRPQWESAEDEKSSLYNSARQRAAESQRTGDIPIDRLGLSEIPDVDVAPPEYAPPVPVAPGGGYKAPSRPVSTFTSGDASLDSPGLVESMMVSQPRTEENRFEGGMNGNPRDGSIGAIRENNAGLSIPSAIPAVVGLSEKEQMKRYLEAKDKVENRGEGSSTSAPVFQNTIPEPVLSDKEQMKRYYAAQDRVASYGQSSSSPNPGTSASSHYPLTPSSPAHTQGISNSVQSQGIISEKEQMRRYHEAMDRVAASQRGEQAGLGIGAPSASGSGYGGQAGLGVGAPSGSGYRDISTPTPTPGPSQVYPEPSPMWSQYADSPSEERSNPISRATSTSPPPTLPPLAPSIPLSTYSANSSPSPKLMGGPSLPTSSYPSALDEKERMKRMYEEANQRVVSASQSRGPPTPPSKNPFRQSVEPGDLSIQSIDLEEEQDENREAEEEINGRNTGEWGRYTGVGLSGSRAWMGAGAGDQGSVRGITRRISQKGGPGMGVGGPEGPPPPLPSRPPAEYINLLSPV